MPELAHQFKLEEPEPVVELELDSPAGGTFDDAGSAPAAPSTPAAPSAPAGAPVGAPVLKAAEPEGSVLKRRRQSRKRSRTPEIVVGVLSALGLGGVAYFVNQAMNEPTGPRQASAEVRQEREAARVRETTGYEMSAGAASALAAGDREVEPITLRSMPAGVSLLVHMRPAELWGDQWELARIATGPLEVWAAAALRDFTGYPPQEIEECTIGWVIGPRGSVPKAAAVFTFVTPPQRSELIRNLRGTLSNQYDVPMQVDAERNQVILVLNDPQDAAALPLGLAVAPAEYATDLTGPTFTSPGVEGLLPATDRSAPLTALFQPLDLELHRDTLFPEPVRPLSDAVQDAFGGWSEAVAIGIGPAAGGGGEVAVTLAVRGTTEDVSSTLGRTASAALTDLPEQLLGYVRTLVPATVGRQRLVGRLPAMVAAAVNGRVGGAEGRVYRAAVKLPPQAAPNIALASLLTWEAGLSGARTAAPTAVAAVAPDNATLVEKLDRPIEVDFRRTPMQEAFLYIGEEAKFAVDLDGNAIRDGGMTQNMTQTFALGRVSAREAIARIMENHPKLAMVADVPQPGTLFVTTYKAAAAAGHTPLSIGPGPPAE